MLKNSTLTHSAWVVISLLVRFSCAAQTLPEEVAIQNPLEKLAPSFYPLIKAPVKSFKYILDKDTISTSYYDKSGNEISKLDVLFVENQ